MRFLSLFLSALLLLATACTPPEPGGYSDDTAQLGQTEFQTSCGEAVRQDFNRALAMLHSFWYEASEAAFREIVEKDSECAMAHWGVAMSRFRQLWGRPSADDLRIGGEALRKARSIESTTERERAYLAALGQVYDAETELDHLGRLQAYEAAMEALSKDHPDDPEASIFYALSSLATAYASAPDPALTSQKRAGALLEGLFSEQPNHPGLAHYIIHSYDYPPLAEEALEAARQYARIAPDAPHALHMPSHIFTRLGLWQESISSNLEAAAAARKDNWTGEEMHATDYLTYAYLQGAQDAEAAKLLSGLSQQKSNLRAADSNYDAGVFAAAAIPARYAVERRQWDEAATLGVNEGFFPGGTRCWAEASLHFARGLGMARNGRAEEAAQAVRQLDDCRTTLTEAGVTLWANRVDVQRRAVAAWLALAEGDADQALGLMRSAADLEDSSDKPPITPGAVTPSRELLGEMLLEADRAAEALVEFERALLETPNRFWSLYGAARAARQSGDEERAGSYASRLLEVAGAADTERPQLLEAREWLESQ